MDLATWEWREMETIVLFIFLNHNVCVHLSLGDGPTIMSQDTEALQPAFPWGTEPTLEKQRMASTGLKAGHIPSDGQLWQTVPSTRLCSGSKHHPQPHPAAQLCSNISFSLLRLLASPLFILLFLFPTC